MSRTPHPHPPPLQPPPPILPTLSFSSACVRSLSSSLDCPAPRPRPSLGCAVFFSTSNVESLDGGRPHRRPEQRPEQIEKQNNTRTSQAGQYHCLLISSIGELGPGYRFVTSLQRALFQEWLRLQIRTTNALTEQSPLKSEVPKWELSVKQCSHYCVSK